MSGASPRASHDLESRRLLALETEGVDRVDELHGVGLREVAHDAEAVVEVAVHRDELRAVDDRLGQLARGDLACGEDDGAAQTRARGVGRRGGARVAGRGAHDHLGAARDGLAHRHRHAAVLEGPRGVRALDLEVDVGAGAGGDAGGGHQGRAALTEGDDRVALVDGKPLGVLGDQPPPLVGHQDPSIRRTERTPRTPGRAPTVSTVAASAASVVSWVATRSSAAPSPASGACRTASIETSC